MVGWEMRVLSQCCCIFAVWLSLAAATTVGQEPLTPEQLKEAVKAAVADAIKPLEERIRGIETRLGTAAPAGAAEPLVRPAAHTEALTAQPPAGEVAPGAVAPGTVVPGTVAPPAAPGTVGPGVLERDLVEAAARAGELLAVAADTGELILPANYFLEEFERQRPAQLPGEQPGATMSLTDTSPFRIACDVVATRMLDIAGQDFAEGEQYLNAWIQQQPQLAEELAARCRWNNAELRDRQLRLWSEFLDVWRQAAVTAAPGRFRDALRQAAYSILRIMIAKEREWVEQVRLDRVGGGGTFAAGGPGTIGPTGFGPVPAAGATWARVHHERKMNAIFHRHYRRSYKIERISARR